MRAFLRGPGTRYAVVVLVAILAVMPACAKRRKEKQASLTPQQLYEMAMAKMAKKRYFTARGLLQEALPRIPPEDRDLLPRVQLAIADAYFRDKGLLNYGEALNGYRNFLTYFPNHENADRAQFMVGMSLFKQVLAPDRDQALTLKAIDEFRKVESVYPSSPYVIQAREQIDACLDVLGDHERLIGRFYQQRRIWPAAIDRYQQILDKYPHYHHTNRVVFALGQCRLALGDRLAAEVFFGQLWHDDPDGPLSVRSKKILANYDREAETAKRRESSR